MSNIRLLHQTTAITVPAIVDSGAALNILPYDIGHSLNLNWNEQTYPLDLGGLLTGTPAYAVLLQAELESFPPLKLAFAWVQKPSIEVRLLLEQVNFFQVFFVPIGWFPRLAHGSPAEKANFELSGAGRGIHWPDLDEDIGIEGLLMGKASMESPASFKRWLEQKNKGQ